MNKRAAWRQTLYRIIFGADTPAGKRFDIALLVLIVLSIALVMIESVPRIHARYGFELEAGEWFITLLFSAEYLLRIFCSPKPRKYIFSFLGIVDLLAIPTGIVSVEMSRTFNEATDEDKKCTHCGKPHHAPEANFCRICGKKLSS